MKRFSLLFSTLLLCCCIMEEQFDATKKFSDVSDNQSASDSYYWFNGKQEPLQKITEYSFVIADEAAAEELNAIVTRSGIVPNGMEYKRYFVPKKIFSMSDESKFVWSKIPTHILNENETDILYSAPYYRTADGFEVGLTNYFMVKLKTASDIDELKQFAMDHSAIVLYGDETDLWYTLTCTSASKMNALELANKAYESGDFASTDVEFVDDIQFVSSPSYNDTRYSTQWNLTSEYGINLDATHSITTGSDSITVAVIDNGFILNHPDMPIDASMSWDANSQTSPARQYYYDNLTVNNHGIGVSGVIGAVPNNGKGIVGIAPGVNLMAISARIEMHDSTDLTALNALKEAIDYANENAADVINNSWNSKIQHESLDDAISSALNDGRAGKGCVVVFASGNDSTNVSKMPYRDNAGVICVGATVIDGFRWLGSNYSEHLDIVAPGSYIPTLGEDTEYRNPDGTSFAAPHVAGIAALMLSVNPSLTNSQVSEILERTARKLPNYTFSETTGRPNGTWHEEVGYGLVNCYDAVNLAYYYDEENYFNLIEFDYSDDEVEISLTAKDNVAIIWDWDAKDISFITARSSSPKDTTISHTYASTGSRHIIIAETVAHNETLPTSSTALTSFELVTGESSSGLDIKPINESLEYVRVIGGSGFASQTVTVSGLPALKNLFLVNMKNSQLNIRNCPSLTAFGTSRHVWIHTSSGGLPVSPADMGAVSPDFIGGDISFTKGWPDLPEKVVSPGSVSISNCPALMTLSLENAGFKVFSFSGLNNLQYVYLSSNANNIVGAGTSSTLSSTFGYYLRNAVTTLPARDPLLKGKIVIRGVLSGSAMYVPVDIATAHKTAIQDYCTNNNWTLVWDSGVK